VSKTHKQRHRLQRRILAFHPDEGAAFIAEAAAVAAVRDDPLCRNIVPGGLVGEPITAIKTAIKHWLTPAQRSAMAARRMARMTPEQRATRGAKISASRLGAPTEVRTERARRSNASWSPERRAAWQAKITAAYAALTPDQHKANGQKSKEQRLAAPDEIKADWGRKISQGRKALPREILLKNVSAINASWTPEKRAAATAKGLDTRMAYTPEERRSWTAKAHASMTPEARRQRTLDGLASLTEEQRQAKAAKVSAHWATLPQEERDIIFARRNEASQATWAAKTPEERKAHGRKSHEAQTPEQRSARQRKAAATARANRLKPR
jgi:hypothetical protein